MSDPRAKVYDKIAEKYDNSYGDRASRAEDDLVYGLLKRDGWGKGSVLDIGCGTGNLLDRLKVSRHNYWGIDISPKMVGRARQKHPLHQFIEWDMDKSLTTRAWNGKFDEVISLYGSISYSRDPKQLLQNLYQVTKPGGRMFIMLYAPGHTNKKTYLPDSLGDGDEDLRVCAQWMPSSQDITDVFWGTGWTNITHRGMSTPAFPPLLRGKLAELWLRAESAVIGRGWPDLCYFHLITAERVL